MDGLRDPDSLPFALGVFDHHNGVCALRNDRARGNGDTLPDFHPSPSSLTCVDRPLPVKIHRGQALRAICVLRPDRIPVHRRAIERRNIDPGPDIARDDPAARPPHGDHLMGRHRSDGTEPDLERLFQRDQLPEGSHFRASQTICPTSGRINFSMANRTAFSDPGSEKTIFPPATPAIARESMAGGPISR